MKNFMYFLGAILVLLGLIGFVNNPIFGIFGVDALHNLVHLVAGILLLVATSKGEGSMRSMAMILGIVVASVTILGFLVGDGKILGLIATNNASNTLHLVVAVLLLFVGFKKNPSGTTMSGAM